MATILICDDEHNLRELLVLALEGVGHRVVEARGCKDAVRKLEEENPDLVITDLRLPDGSGLDILRQAKKWEPGRPVLLITAYASTETAVTAMKEGAFEYLEKPFAMEDFHLVVTRALEQAQLTRENARLRQALSERQEKMLGSSPAMRRLHDLALRAARTSATVLITGESGTGKELVARVVHQASHRANGPFVAINCAAMPETLIESELFGHVKGAFSGAITSRKGLFMEADGGTLLLDEIGDMPLATQVKLLRVLQERVVRPLGGAGEKPVDVRVLATTNRDLARDVAEGRFREDLFYRLQVINLLVPTLRERREDIPLLVARFIERSARRFGLPVKGIEPQALTCLIHYDFPGNVRELENMIEGLVSLTMGEVVELASLPDQVRKPAAPICLAPAICQEWVVGDEGLDLEAVLAVVEGNLIRQALERAEGNKTRAAELLKLSFRSFRYRLAKLGIDNSGP